METPWNHRYAQRTQRMGSSVIRELLKFTELPEIISFAGGMPAPEVFPLEEIKRACIHVLDNLGPQSLQYGTTEGYLPLREQICRHTERYGIKIGPENVMIVLPNTDIYYWFIQRIRWGAVPRGVEVTYYRSDKTLGVPCDRRVMICLSMPFTPNGSHLWLAH